eukprot:1145139-Pelagomonas_calceolata.AAC.1
MCAPLQWKTDHAALIYVVAENERTNEQMQFPLLQHISNAELHRPSDLFIPHASTLCFAHFKELRRAFQGEYKECPIEVGSMLEGRVQVYPLHYDAE